MRKDIMAAKCYRISKMFVKYLKCLCCVLKCSFFLVARPIA
nr:MAG TPA: hypothetical protein [Caudoviricetes sp.]